MRHTLTIFVLSLLLATPVWASPLGDTRQVHESAKSDFGRLWAARSALDQAHEALAGEIETLKSARGAELVPDVQDGTLDNRLKRAKAMALELADLDRRVAAARTAYAGARSALVTALESEILRLQVSLSEVGREERLARFERLRTLVEERRALPVAPVAKTAPVVLPAPPDGVVVSAEELRELVDETRDHAERVQAQLDQITARVDALRERRRLLRAAADFHRDDALFAESERNRRVVTGAREGLPTVQGPVRTVSNPADGEPNGRAPAPQGESDDLDGAQAQANPEPVDEGSPPGAEQENSRGESDSDAPVPEQDSASEAGGSDPAPEASLGSSAGLARHDGLRGRRRWSRHRDRSDDSSR